MEKEMTLNELRRLIAVAMRKASAPKKWIFEMNNVGVEEGIWLMRLSEVLDSSFEDGEGLSELLHDVLLGFIDEIDENNFGKNEVVLLNKILDEVRKIEVLK